MHIVVICVDAMRADHIGCYAGEDRGTPVMDGLARDGVLFRNATAQASWTRPSVTSMMTGLYPSQHVMTDAPGSASSDGVVRMVALDQTLPTLPATMAAAGWSTAAFVAGNAYLKPEFGVLGGFGHLDWVTSVDGDLVLDRYATWLNGAPGARTFAYLHLMETHNPLPAGLAPARPQVDKGLDMTTVAFGEETLRGYYADAVARADAQVGKVLAALAAAGRLEETWVAVTADHGEELNEHGAMLSHGQSLYRSLTQVPLLMRLPGPSAGGRVVDGPVSHIDLFPTFVEAAGLTPPAHLPGISLVGALHRGEEPGNGGVAFSEMVKRVKYARSVTTAEHHLIETFYLSSSPKAEPSDLVPGVPVEVKGQPVDDGVFIPTKISIDPKACPKVLGTVDAVDADGGRLTVMGLSFAVDAATDMIGLDKAPFGLADLAPGDRVNADFDPAELADGRLRASRLTWRKPGGESKVEGLIETSWQNGHWWFTLLGHRVPVDPSSVRLVDRNHDVTEWKRDAVVDMVRQGRYVSRSTELYAFGEDPDEQHNLTAQEPALAARLEGLLAAWADGITAEAGGAEVQVDDATIEQLRALGYLA